MNRVPWSAVFPFMCFCFLASTLACSSEKPDWEAARKERTVEAVNRFLGQHPEGEHAKEARRLLAALEQVQAWKSAESVNTIEAYEKYLETYPATEHRGTALRRIEEIREEEGWRTASSAGTAEALREYLQEFPEGAHADAAQAKIPDLHWAPVAKLNTIPGYVGFLASDPSQRHRAMARDAILRLQLGRSRELPGVCS